MKMSSEMSGKKGKRSRKERFTCEATRNPWPKGVTFVWGDLKSEVVEIRGGTGIVFT